MKKIKTIILLASLVLGAFAFETWAQLNRKSANVRLTVLNSMERIGQTQELFGELQANIKAARNEVESFQVVVHALQKNIVVVKAQMSDLVGSGGTIKKENAALYREEYTRVRLSSPRAELPPGLYADPLVPFINPQTGKAIEPRSQSREAPDGPVITKGFEMYATPFEVWKGANQPLWIDISIPKEVAAGEYKGIFILGKLSDSEAVAKIVSTIVPNWWAKPSAKDFLTVRERIANEILKLSK